MSKGEFPTYVTFIGKRLSSNVFLTMFGKLFVFLFYPDDSLNMSNQQRRRNNLAYFIRFVFTVAFQLRRRYAHLYKLGLPVVMQLTIRLKLR